MNTQTRLTHAIAYVIFCSAVVHLAILAIEAIATKNIVLVNYFNILDLEYFFPGIDQGTTSQSISAALMLGFIAIAYGCFARKEK